ncbi:hypothetical protein AB0I28_12575 [Phytomonospora sp. NPDC050363]|uniref:hypothetical protein n=1 Tax=Phytomonospora sp. NPDC050363 TaxID=3155642 RepID=UPI0033F2468C
MHIPAVQADDSLLYSPRHAFESGQVRGVSKAEITAVKLGADPSQVVNSRRGMYTAGGRKYTRTATTRRGVAGARMLARDVDRLLGRSTTGTYMNVTFSREKAARYSELLRKGRTFTRSDGSTGSYRFAKSRRPTVEQILAGSKDRTEVIRLLTNFGYVL